MNFIFSGNKRDFLAENGDAGKDDVEKTKSSKI